MKLRWKQKISISNKVEFFPKMGEVHLCSIPYGSWPADWDGTIYYFITKFEMDYSAHEKLRWIRRWMPPGVVRPVLRWSPFVKYLLYNSSTRDDLKNFFSAYDMIFCKNRFLFQKNIICFVTKNTRNLYWT
jgi:hypothetical protein